MAGLNQTKTIIGTKIIFFNVEAHLSSPLKFASLFFFFFFKSGDILFAFQEKRIKLIN